MGEDRSAAAARMRRLRAHRAGDHSLCEPGKCGAATAVLDERAGEHANEHARDPGSIGHQLSETFAGVAEMCPHCRMRLAALLRVAAFIDSGESKAPETISAARELRLAVDTIRGCDHIELDYVEQLRARREARQLDRMLASLTDDDS